MTLRSRYKNFETAIDAEAMRERFQRELRKFRGDDFSISHIFVTRYSPQGPRFHHQYEIYPRESRGIRDKGSFYAAICSTPPPPCPAMSTKRRIVA
jgi:hypothetical protein